MDQPGLADFLRRRRAALTPSDLGLEPGQRRRTAGLRREEVAGLAFISTGFYTRLEQARGSRPSAQTVAAISRALRLTPQERSHLFELAGHTAPAPAFRADHASPGLLRVLGQLQAPAQVVSDLGVTLVQNGLARALVGDQTRHSGLRRSVIHRWFTDPDERRIHPEEDHLELSRSHVAGLRAVHGAPREDSEADELVAHLLEASDEFAALWDRHEVGSRSGTLKRFLHPVVGTLTLDCQVLTAEAVAERLVVFAPTPGGDATQKLELLAIVGTQDFAPSSPRGDSD